MKPVIVKILSVVMLLIGIAAPAYSGDRVILATLDWEPYVSESLHDHGYLAVIVQEAFSRSGIEAEFRFNQLNRTAGTDKSQKPEASTKPAEPSEVAAPTAPAPTASAPTAPEETEEFEEVDGYFPEYYSEQVKSYAAFSDPIPAGALGFFKLRKSEISYTELADLIGYRIGIVRGYQNTAAFDNAAFLTKDYAENDLANFKKLAAGQIDLLVADKFVGMQLIKSHMPEMKNEINFLDIPLENRDLYLCISSKYLHGGALLKAFDEGLRQMKEDGTLDKILREHGFL
jgi:hypothetical protein